jgi:O-antigen ligase
MICLLVPYSIGIIFFIMFAYIECERGREFRMAFILSFFWLFVIIVNVLRKLL